METEIDKKIAEELIFKHMQEIRRILAENPDIVFEWPFKIVDLRYDPYKCEYIVDSYIITHSRTVESRPQ